MSSNKLLHAELDPRNPSYAYKNKKNEYVENTSQFKQYLKDTSFKKVFTGMLWGETGMLRVETWMLRGETGMLQVDWDVAR